jgi:hypothetical protein
MESDVLEAMVEWYQRDPIAQSAHHPSAKTSIAQ